MFWNKKKYANGYSTVSVNGKTVRVRGNSISIINDQIIVDGKTFSAIGTKKLRKESLQSPFFCFRFPIFTGKTILNDIVSNVV